MLHQEFFKTSLLKLIRCLFRLSHNQIFAQSDFRLPPQPDVKCTFSTMISRCIVK